MQADVKIPRWFAILSVITIFSIVLTFIALKGLLWMLSDKKAAEPNLSMSFDDRLYLGKTADEIQQEYGAFKKVLYEYDEILERYDENSIQVGGYYMYKDADNGEPYYYCILFDGNGEAINCYISYNLH